VTDALHYYAPLGLPLITQNNIKNDVEVQPWHKNGYRFKCGWHLEWENVRLSHDGQVTQTP